MAQDTTKITSFTKQYVSDIEGYKKFAEARNKARKYKQEFASTLTERLDAYMEECEAMHKPCSMARMILASGVNRDTFQRMRNGEYDYIAEQYRIEHEHCALVIDDFGNEYIINEDGVQVSLVPFSAIIEKSILRLEAMREEACGLTRGNPAGNIFLLKSLHGFKEEQEPKELHQNLIIADGNRAKDIIKLLGE